MGRVQCATCGFQDSAVTPADAAAALRSYPRRFRAVLVRPDDDEGADVILRPASDGWSALDHAAHVAVSFGAVAEALRLASIEEQPLVALAPERREPAVGPVDDVLAALEDAAGRAAGSVESIKGADWNRRARLGEGDDVSALDLARHAVHEGVHHLRGAEHAVSEA
jgi:DinB superfamily